MKKVLLTLLLTLWLLLCSFTNKYSFQGDYKCTTTVKNNFFETTKNQEKGINIHLNFYDKEGVLVIDTCAISLTECERIKETEDVKAYIFNGIHKDQKMRVSLVYKDRKLDAINISRPEDHIVYSFWILQENSI